MVYLKTLSFSPANVIEIWMFRRNEEKGPAAAIKGAKCWTKAGIQIQIRPMIKIIQRDKSVRDVNIQRIALANNC